MSSSRFATIHGGLLARKGEAAPAVRHPGHQVSYGDHPPLPVSGGDRAAPSRAAVQNGRAPDLPSRPATAPVATAAVATRPAPCVGKATDDAAGATVRPPARAASSEEGWGRLPRARVSMRLTERQRRLIRIATAVLGRSQQSILSDALDGHLERLGATELKSCTCFARHAAGDRDPKPAPQRQ